MIQMNITEYLKPGDLYVSKEPALYKTVLGSCISICLHDRRLKTGGINHFIYASAGKGNSSDFYGDISSENLIRKMLDSGSKLNDLVACVIGGATGFSISPTESPGSRNIKVACAILEKWRIPIIESDIGGKTGRILIFYTESNEIIVEKIKTTVGSCLNVPL